MEKPNLSKIASIESLESVQQEEANRYATEQRLLREKVTQELQEHNQRHVLLVETAHFFRRLEKSGIENRQQERSRKDWADFLSCRKYPDLASESEMQGCLYRWTFQQGTQAKSLVSWTLAAEEKCYLAQDPGRKRRLREDATEIQRNLPEIYLATTREALAALESIEDGLHEMKKEEVLSVHDEIRKFVSDSLDRMTIQIASNIDRDMVTLDPWRSEFHHCEPDVLTMFLWSFRHVPLPPDYNLLIKVINMSPLGLSFHRPPMMDLKESLIRGLWLEFDHYSHKDPTRTVSSLEFMPELISAQETEWNDRQEVRRKRLETLRKEREEYEGKERSKLAEAEALAAEAPKVGKRVTQEAKGRKKKNPSKQNFTAKPIPPLITDETEVDIDAEFAGEESDRFWAKLASVGPDSLPLAKGYINLREYAIVGGVYKLARFDKLPQLIEQRSGLMYANVPVGLQLSEKGFRAVSDEELIKIELHLPTQYCWWEQPTVCCWEPWEESDHFAQLRPEVQQFQLSYTAIEAHKSKLLFAARDKIAIPHSMPKIIQDFDLANVPVEVRLHYLILEHILPRLPDGYRFRAELKRLFTVLKDRTRRRMARGLEHKTRNSMMQKYDRFREANHKHHDDGLQQIRLPQDSDIGVEWEKIHDRKEMADLITVKPQDTTEELQVFSLVRMDAPRHLHPPNTLHRPLVVVGFNHSETTLDELGSKIDELVQALESSDAMLEDQVDERLCNLFSIFLKLLEHLREKEKPQFPPLPPASPEHAKSKEIGAILIKEIKQRNVDIRTTKKHPLGLGLRTRSMSGGSGSFKLKGEQKKRKRKGTPVHSKKSSQPLEDARLVESSESANEVLTLIEHGPGRWSTKPIQSELYDATKHTLTFCTDRLGVFGLAARRYCHLPFLHWSMRRHGRVANLTTVITLRASEVDISFYITSKGFQVQLQSVQCDMGKSGSIGKADGADIRIAPESGSLTLEKLEKYLQKINVHVFPQVDTVFYTTGRETGSTTAPKHESMELHNLRCLGAFCLTHNFERCVWNEFSDRRTALVLSRQLVEGRHDPEFETIMITPLKAQLVEVEELCSSSLEQVLLAFHPRPKNQSYNADWYGLLRDSMEEPSRKVLAKTPPLLQWNVGQLLQKLRLLSYS